jgi:hypothetical protein
MRNAESIKKRLDDAKALKSYTEALAALADIQFDIGVDACNERSELRDQIRVLRERLFGNGNPDKSIVSRLKLVEDTIEEFTRDTKSDIHLIKTALIGDVDGKKGLLDRMETSERLNANLIKVMWIAVSIIIAELIANLMGLL